MSKENICLCLAAGGARGAYQAGALLFFSEKGILFDRIAGTSVGSLNGAFYAQGDGSPGHLQNLIEKWRMIPEAKILVLSEETKITVFESIIEIFLTNEITSISDLLIKLSVGELTILDPKPIASILDQWICYRDVCSSNIDFTISVFPAIFPLIDIISGNNRKTEYLNAKGLGPERLRQALLASIAIPFVFPSQELENKGKFIDAGLADPLPAKPLLQQGGQRIVSIFLSDTIVQNPLDYTNCILFQVRPSININESFFSTFDFSRPKIESLIDLGYNDARTQFNLASHHFEKLMELHEMGKRIQKLADLLPTKNLTKI